MLNTVLIIVGVILLIIGILGIIRFDGSVKRIVVCAILIVAGLAASVFGYYKKNYVQTEYTVTIEDISANDNSKQYRVTLGAGSNSTIIFVDETQLKDFEGKTTITMTEAEIGKYRK